MVGDLSPNQSERQEMGRDERISIKSSLGGFCIGVSAEMFSQCHPKGKDVLLCTQISMPHPSAQNPELMSDLA